MFRYARTDAVAGIVVFLVALPLCLGIAIACGVPPVSGLLAGVIGGVVIPFFSRAALSVSGPAAGLTSVVLLGIRDLGGLAPFFVAVAIAGVMQLGFGIFRMGRYSSVVPSAVIKGMLAAIGITIVMKQIGPALGSTLPAMQAFGDVHLGSAVIAAVSLVLLYTLPMTPLRKLKWLSPAFVTVAMGVVLAEVFSAAMPSWALSPAELISLPTGGPVALFEALPKLDWSSVSRTEVWVLAITIAFVASIETLLSVQAVDRLDPMGRKSPLDRELVAQGIANTASGLLGGLPVTSVIVRSGANVAAGGRERFASVVHGALLAIAVMAFAGLLNRIPISCLAAVLIQVGLNLFRPSLVREQWKLGLPQFVPFAMTIAAILATDLLKGVVIGVLLGVVIMVYDNAKGAIESMTADGRAVLKFRRDGTFVGKPFLIAALEKIPEGGRVLIDATGEFLDYDTREVLANFVKDAPRQKIDVEVKGVSLDGISGSGH